MVERETVAVDTASGTVADAPAATPRGGRWWLVIGAVLAAVPLARMARWVLSGTDTQYADYWLMIDEILLPGGGFRIEELFTFSNDHPVAIPKLIYWLNVHNTGGSNIALGLVVVVIVAMLLALLADVLWRSAMPSLVKIAILVAASALLFSPLGAWNFLKAMSGTAWLTANTCAVAALVMRSRGRVWTACALGVAACLSYGTGLAVWPSLLAVGLLSDRRLRNQWPTAVVTVAVATGYWFGRSTGEAHTAVAGPTDLARFTIEVLSGAIWSSNRAGAVWIGGAVFAAAVVVAIPLLWFGRGRVAAPWLGVSMFGVGGSFLLALGRADSVIAFRSNRHFALSALVIIGTIGMLGSLIDGRPMGETSRARPGRRIAASAMALVTVGLAAAGFLASRSEVDAITRSYSQQERLAIALRFGLAAGTREPLGGFAEMPDGIEALLDANDHVPFRDDALDCGLADQTVDLDAIDELPEGVAAKLVRSAQALERSDVAGGWIRDPRDLVRCIVVVDGSGQVVGAGVTGPPDEGYSPGRAVPPGADGFVTVQPLDTEDATYLLVLRDGTLAAIPDAEDAIRF